jgi:crotonobetainyl-CoA:carnitine CoA-transferase CaiB-like acyl-CoA transferase
MMDQSPAKPENELPLAGLRVVALEQAVAAPFCSRQLADMGADVVKIERPDGGDFARGYDGALNGLSAYFAWLNRGKRSITLDLKSEAGRTVLQKLLGRADVFIHNLAPGAVERLGFGYETVREIFPRLIWAGITGYGPDGPYRDKKAYDMLIQAESGVISLTGTPEAAAKVGISIADIAAGLYGYSSILAALLNRAKTGHGERIDISMLECLVEWVMPPIYVFLGTGSIPTRAGLRHNMIIPYGSYSCSDGAVLFSIQNETEWQHFCELVLEQPTLASDAHFATNSLRLQNRAALEAQIEAYFSQYSVATVIDRLERANIAHSLINDIAAVVDHPQLAVRRRWVNVESFTGQVRALIPPHNLSGISPCMNPIPSLGEHTSVILAELGIAGFY